MKTVVITQARMTSTRLPGKVLLDVEGTPLLSHHLQRLKRCERVDEIVVATTTNVTDDPIVALADDLAVRWFRGSEDDVLERYWGAATEAGADLVVRVTSDCPLIDPEVTDEVIARAETGWGAVDYVSNIIRRTFPRGLDTEAFSFDVLGRIHEIASSPESREHVTHFLLQEARGSFVLDSVENQDGLHLERHSWTVDTERDLEFIRALFGQITLGDGGIGFREIAAFLEERPELVAINADVVQKTP